MSFPFNSHLQLLTRFLDQRELVAEEIESRLLNVRGNEISRARQALAKDKDALPGISRRRAQHKFVRRIQSCQHRLGASQPGGKF